MVEISGFFDGAGVIWATFLEKTGEFSSGVLVEVTGYVKNLDDVLETFKINGLMVDYSSADTGDLPEGGPTEGLWVEVAGRLDELLLVGACRPTVVPALKGTLLTKTKLDQRRRAGEQIHRRDRVAQERVDHR